MSVQEIEKRWQKRWFEERIFEAESGGKEKFFITVPYPYLNGNLHVGHTRTFVIGDVLARYNRMMGYNVLFPMAFHVTGTPLVGLSELIRNRDERTIKVYNDLHKIPKDILFDLNTPEKLVNYFKKESEIALSDMGCSIDWRRKFTTMDPPYKKFIRWQFGKLKSKGLIARGLHPVRWCPNCKNPVEDHDLLRGEGANILDYTLIKFSLDGYIIPCATLRPETVFGATNLWVNPAVTYLIAKIGEEEWMIGERAFEKLSHTDKHPEKIGEIEGRDLIGRYAKNPMNEEEVIVLPATFVDPTEGSGIVMSVPAHAPYDYLALRDLKEGRCDYDLTEEISDLILKIEPIKLIDLPGYGDFPALTVIDELKVKDQMDPKAEKATKIVYKREFHDGILNDVTRRYEGYKVSEVKEIITKEMLKEGKADIFHELSEPVTCRCGTECVVKLVEDQWFLTYSKKEWKDEVLDCLSSMKIIPEEYRKEFENKVDWLKDKACARRRGLGTRLPWDKDWLIESLADSTIYMAYYILSKYINEGRIKEEELDDQFFDYVLLGIGEQKSDLHKEIRNEFEYWYPVDLRSSGKDLVPNHLLFFLFHHVAIFPRRYWPRAIAVNGFVSLEGEKMSKSRGPLFTMREAIDEYGADVTRFYILGNSEHIQDADWRSSRVKDAKRALERFYGLAEDIIQRSKVSRESGKDLSRQDRWILHRMQVRIKEARAAMENIQTRRALQNAFYLILNDIKWYRKRGENPKVLLDVLDLWVRLLAPFIPHICEEIWSRMNGGPQNFISLARYPEVDEGKIDHSIEIEEDLLRDTIEDIREILAVTKIEPKKIVIYTAPEWKRDIYKTALKLKVKGALDMGSLMRTAIKDHANTRRISNFAKKMVREVELMGQAEVKILANSPVDEFETMKKAEDFISYEFGCEVSVFDAEFSKYDPAKKSDAAMPLRPAIYVE